MPTRSANHPPARTDVNGMAGALRLVPVWKVYTIGGAALCVAYFVVPWVLATTVFNVVINLAAAVAVVVGPARRGTAARRPWAMMSAALLAFACGTAYYGTQVGWAGHDVFPSVADYLLLSGQLFLVAALAGFVRVGGGALDRPSLIDALIMSAGAGTLSWVFLLSPHVHSGGLSGPARAVLLAYPVVNLFALGLVLRLAIGRGTRSAPRLMLVAAVASGLASDATYSYLMLTGDYRFGDPIDIGWLAMRILLGAAALHPDAATGFVPAPTGSTGVIGNGRFAALALAGLAAPAALTIQWLRDEPMDVPVIAVGAAVLFLLVAVRLRTVMTGLADALRTVEKQANTYQLTGLANRRHFHDRWQREVFRGAGRAALLYVDLDGFKPVNDSFGHDTGDAVLVAVAERMRATVRADDLIARVGGDEFAVILSGADGEHAGAVADRIVAAISAPFTVPCAEGDIPVRIGASVGVALAADGDDPDAVLRRADAAMYQVKSSGRGRVGTAAPEVTAMRSVDA